MKTRKQFDKAEQAYFKAFSRRFKKRTGLTLAEYCFIHGPRIDQFIATYNKK